MMICSICGSTEVTWQGPLTNLTHTECPDCGATNCQVIEDFDELEEEETES
jgi:translation initiation factor 2 beta subunit (eIF-2beta)/eIF-5